MFRLKKNNYRCLLPFNNHRTYYLNNSRCTVNMPNNANSKEPLILSIDVGTTSVRTMLFKKTSEVMKKTQINYASSNASDGIGELCGIKDINNNIIYCLNDLFANLDRSQFEVVSIGIANMRESLITWNSETLLPLNKCILWNDTRNKELIGDLKGNMTSDQLVYFRKHTGLNNLSTYFSAGKLKWLLNNDLKNVHLNNADQHINAGTVDSWILANFTKEKVFKTDVSNACRTGLFNLDTLKNDPELFKMWSMHYDDLYNTKKVRFPEIVSSSEFYGKFHLPSHFTDFKIRKNISSWIENVPIQGCLGDQSASLVGHLKFLPSEIKMTYGTGCFLLLNAGKQRPVLDGLENKLLTTIGYKFPFLDEGNLVYAIEGTIGQAGFLVNWLINNINLVDGIEQLTEIIKAHNTQKSPNDIVFVPALTGIYAPYWDDNCRGAIFGIDANTKQKDLVIACLKGLALQVGTILQEMRKHIKKNNIEISIDGGLSQNNEFLKLQASLLLENDFSLVRNVNHEATSFGCAIASAFAYPKSDDRIMWKDLNDLKENVRTYQEALQLGDSNTFICNNNIDYIQTEYHKWNVALQRSTSWLSDIKTGKCEKNLSSKL